MKTLSLANAPILVVVGKKARDLIGNKLGRELILGDYVEREIAGKKRIILAIHHPNARVKRSLPDNLIEKIQTAVVNVQ